MDSLAPIYPIGGGLLIGLAAALLLLLSGRIAGISGMLAATLRIADKGPPWRQAAALVAGLPIGALLVSALGRRPQIVITSSVFLLIVAGVLVGFGTRLGNGCTSGHGVCGVARLSPRSIGATATFMAVGFVTAFIMRHGIGG
jgi:uncharacterized membrane protein YedE/YeeE